LKKPYGKSVDYYSIGMMAYEMMLGEQKHFLKGKGLKEILSYLNTGSTQVRKSDLPEDWSFDAADFINRLIQRRPESRLGYEGVY
jgi:serum/glucocorticoid-regulated kinase 2